MLVGASSAVALAPGTWAVNRRRVFTAMKLLRSAIVRDTPRAAAAGALTHVSRHSLSACVTPVLQNRFRGVPPGKIDPFLIDVFVLSAKCKKTVAKSAKVLQLFPPKHPYLVVSTTVRACAYSPAISR